MPLRSLPCNLKLKIKDFLANEIKEEYDFVNNAKPIYARSVETIRKDDFYYTLLEPNEELSRFDDGTWVRISKGGFSSYGSLWFTDEETPYILTGEPVPRGLLQIVEADGLQLLLMQKEAYSTLLAESSLHTIKLSKIIFCNHEMENPLETVHPITFYDPRIAKNSSQMEAVKKSLAAAETDSFFLIHGPPGTGKTTVITEIVKQLVAKGKKVLITSHTNVAVNNVMENLAEDPNFRLKMVRLGPRAKVSKVLKDLVPTHENEFIKLSLAQIVGATLSKLSILVLNKRLNFNIQYFDTVIVDESSMATIPLTLAGILHGKSFILVGDHKQLPPITRTKFPENCQNKYECGRLCESLFRLLIEQCPERSKLLELQFRSHPQIMEFSQTYIYNGKIRSSDECFTKKINIHPIQREQVPGTINDKPLCYVNMCYTEPPIEWFPSNPQLMGRRKTPSCFNMLEAVTAIKIRHDLMKAGVSPERIWIITPFRIQREMIRKAIKMIYGTDPEDTVISIYENILASTVDAIQGKENDVIIYSLTWVPSSTRIVNLHPALMDERRLNVALTRARKKLIILGDLSWLSIAGSKGGNYYELLENYLNKHGAEITAPEIDKNDDFLKVVQYCFQKKKREEIPSIIKDEVRKAIRRIREDLGIFPQTKRWIIKDENDFQKFRNDPIWLEIKLTSKQIIYDLRTRNTSMEIIYTFNSQTKKPEAYIKSYDKQSGIRKIPLELEI